MTKFFDLQRSVWTVTTAVEAVSATVLIATIAEAADRDPHGRWAPIVGTNGYDLEGSRKADRKAISAKESDR